MSVSALEFRDMKGHPTCPESEMFPKYVSLCAFQGYVLFSCNSLVDLFYCK